MADFATPSAATMTTMDASADVSTASKTQVTKPERPDEDSYKKALAAAEKALAEVQEKQVSMNRAYQREGADTTLESEQGKDRVCWTWQQGHACCETKG